MAPLTFDGREVERERESKAGEKAGKKEQPRAPQPSPVTVDDGKHRHQNDIRDHVVLVAGAACRGGELSLDEFRIAGRARDEIALPVRGHDEMDVEPITKHDRRDAGGVIHAFEWREPTPARWFRVDLRIRRDDPDDAAKP